MSDHIIIIQNSVYAKLISFNTTNKSLIFFMVIFDACYLTFIGLIENNFHFLILSLKWLFTWSDITFWFSSLQKDTLPLGMCFVCLTVDHLIEPKWIKCKKTHGELSDIVSHFKLWLILSLKMSSRLKKGDFWFP